MPKSGRRSQIDSIVTVSVSRFNGSQITLPGSKWARIDEGKLFASFVVFVKDKLQVFAVELFFGDNI